MCLISRSVNLNMHTIPSTVGGKWPGQHFASGTLHNINMKAACVQAVHERAKSRGHTLAFGVLYVLWPGKLWHEILYLQSICGLCHAGRA